MNNLELSLEVVIIVETELMLVFSFVVPPERFIKGWIKKVVMLYDGIFFHGVNRNWLDSHLREDERERTNGLTYYSSGLVHVCQNNVDLPLRRAVDGANRNRCDPVLLVTSSDFEIDVRDSGIAYKIYGGLPMEYTLVMSVETTEQDGRLVLDVEASLAKLVDMLQSQQLFKIPEDFDYSRLRGYL